MTPLMKVKMTMQAQENFRRSYPATSRAALCLLGAVMLVAVVFVNDVSAQEEETPKPVATRRTNGGRDPFKRYEPPRPVNKRDYLLSPVPSIQERINHYRAQKAAAMSARMPAPKPTTALLLSEIQVIGISRSPRGYAAIVEATPIKLSYVVYPGEPFFNGQLVAIEDNRLVFRRETVYANGRRERSVEYKTLRQPNQVNALPTPAAVAAANP